MAVAPVDPCATHEAFRSPAKARRVARLHRSRYHSREPCPRCAIGMRPSVWPCGDHYHWGHSW